VVALHRLDVARRENNIYVMIKTVIFDLNGVFILSPKLSDRFENDFNVPASEFLPKLAEIMDQVRRPYAGAAFSYWEPALKAWGVEMKEEQFWNYWFGAETPSSEMITLAKEFKVKGLKVIMLSNNFKERAEYYEHYPWMHDVVDKAYFSWQTGFVKPDVKAWELVLKDFSLKPEEAVYFDDQEKNLKAAQSLGIHSFMFDSPAEVKSLIASVHEYKST
jgi:HAD superfamily hydrolase (TIGR01509 family)